MSIDPPQNEALPIENSLDLLLVLLYAPGATKERGEPISGITRLQKLVFLLKQGEGPAAIVDAAKTFLYEAYKMGPFSKQLYDDLDVLTSLGLVRTTKLEYLITDDSDPDEISDSVAGGGRRVVESTRYSLTEKGMQVGRDLFASLKRRERDALSEFKRFFNSIPLRQLLIFVYQRFPDFTTESEIREQLGL
jgi:hypothetical protein